MGLRSRAAGVTVTLSNTDFTLRHGELLRLSTTEQHNRICAFRKLTGLNVGKHFEKGKARSRWPMRGLLQHFGGESKVAWTSGLAMAGAGMTALKMEEQEPRDKMCR